MSDQKDLLKQMINHIVYDREDEAKTSFHDFVAAKTQSIMGTTEEVPEETSDVDTETEGDIETEDETENVADTDEENSSDSEE